MCNKKIKNFFGLTARIDVIPFTDVFKGHKPKNAPQKREAIDVLPTWLLPVVSQQEDGSFELWQSPDVWDDLLCAYLPKHTYAIIIIESTRKPSASEGNSKHTFTAYENTPSHVADIKEFINFYSLLYSKLAVDAVLKKLYQNETLRTTIEKYLLSPIKRSLTDKFVHTYIAKQSVSESTIGRLKRLWGMTNPPALEAKWNRNAKESNRLTYKAYIVELQRIDPVLAELFVESLNTPDIDCDKLYADINALADTMKPSRD